MSKISIFSTILDTRVVAAVRTLFIHVFRGELFHIKKEPPTTTSEGPLPLRGFFEPPKGVRPKVDSTMAPREGGRRGVH